MKLSRTLFLGAAAAAALASASPARACSVCGCGDPLLAASDPAAITGKLRLQLDTDYLRMDAGTEGNPNSTDQLSQWSYRFNAAYRPIDDLSFLVTVPLVSKTMKASEGGATTPMSDLTGLGDIEVAARYAFFRSVDLAKQRAWEVAVTGGSMLPTGEHNATADGVLIDAHGQIGTGGWGPFLGLAFLFEQKDWLAFANASYRVRTEATYDDGSKYKFGDAVLWSVHGQYRPMRRLALDLGVDGRYAMRDRQTEADGNLVPQVENTGGTVLSAAPGVYFEAGAGIWLFARGQIPFATSLYGLQKVYPGFTTGLQFQAF
ncbi:MAG TPA: hypothetical protein VFP65_22310 [Anaeromyxobacteraceae bacterium]|nr:hypothetical protein [Anaeromyxobacteraceae bacterium]